MSALLCSAFVLACLGCPPGDAGTVVVVGGDLETVQFALPAGIDYQLGYAPLRLAIWFDAQQTQPAPPGTTFPSPPGQIPHGDMNGDARVSGDDIQTFVDVLLGNNTDPNLLAQADFDENGVVDQADVPRFVAALLGEQRTGDVNRDGQTDGRDIQPFLAVLLGAALLPGDLDEDGDVDLTDLGLFADVLLGLDTDPGLVGRADLNGDGLAHGNDIQPFVQAFLNPAPAPDPNAADLNFSGAVDLADLPLFVDVLLFGITAPSNATITLFAEGLAPSADLCDTPADLLTDPDGDGTFALAATVEFTVVDLNFSPLTGGLGTPITITMTPAIPPLAFDAGTTATWTGVFQPMAGVPTAPFTITYSPAQFRESSASQAVIIAGDGSLLNPPDVAHVSLPGSLPGVLTLHFAACDLSKNVPFDPVGGPILTTIQYDANAQPFVGPTPDSLEIVITTNGNGSDEILLAGNYFNHLAVALEIARNAFTDGEAPAAILVTLISRTTAGAELQSTQNLPLLRDDVASNPTTILYHSDFQLPIVLVDVFLDPAGYSLVLPVHAVDQGEIAILPQGL